MDRNIALMMREDLHSVKVVFGCTAGHTFDGGKTAYTYATNLSFEQGDFAVVKVGDSLKIVTITEVHETLEIEPNSDLSYELIVQKIDLEAYLGEKRKLKELEEVLHEEYRRRARLSAREVLLASLDDSGRSKVLALLGEQK